METAISLSVVTRRQMFQDGPKELVAVLQIRGEENHETGWSESFPGVCQTLVHGKVKLNESPQKALQREIKEELGERFLNLLKTDSVKARTDGSIPASGEIVEIRQVLKPNKTIIHYAAEVPSEQIELIRFNASTGGLRYLRGQNLIRVQDVVHHGYHKATGVESHSVTVMFDDDFGATKAALTLFENRKA